MWQEESVSVESNASEVVLHPGEIHRQQKFGSNTINRGAVLIECDWDGGRFEAGLFMGGIFRSGQFAGGTFLGGIFIAGSWIDGTWIGGFDREGFYQSRGAIPSTR